jgi:all-trans-retinol dehydrogenase (NAD+)
MEHRIALGFTKILLLMAEVFIVAAKMGVHILTSLMYTVVSPPVRYSLKDKRVLITGSAGGLGSEIALQLVDKGASVILVDKDIEKNQLIYRQVQEKMAALGSTGRVKRYVCDLCHKNEVQDTVNGIIRDMGSVDVIINNAGVLDGELITDVSESAFLKSYQVNVFSHFYLIKAFLPGMIRQDSGHIVTIGSIVGHSPVAQLPAYCSTKAAAGNLLECVAADLDKMGVTGVGTTLVCPGHIDTPMFKNVWIRFPFLTPTLSPEEVAAAVIDGIERRKRVLYLPTRYFWAVILKHVLPTEAYNQLHEFLKTSYGMVSFEGRKIT